MAGKGALRAGISVRLIRGALRAEAEPEPGQDKRNSYWMACNVGGATRPLDQNCLVVIGRIGRHSRIMRRKRSEGESAPMTLGQALTAKVRLIVWCKACGHRAEPAVADQVASYGDDIAVIDWARCLRCSAC